MPKPEMLRPQPHPARCASAFDTAAARQRKYVEDLEHILRTTHETPPCHVQNERVNSLILSLLTGRRPLNTRFRLELEKAARRRKLRRDMNMACSMPQRRPGRGLRELMPLGERPHHKHRPARARRKDFESAPRPRLRGPQPAWA